MLTFLLRALLAAAGLWLAARLVGGIEVHGIAALAAAAVLLGIVNAVIRPVVFLLTLPFTLVTFGLFLLVINAAMLGLVSFLLRAVGVSGFEVHGFWAALLGALVVSLVGWIGSLFIHRTGR